MLARGSILGAGCALLSLCSWARTQATGETFTVEVVDEDGALLPEARFQLVDLERADEWGWPRVLYSTWPAGQGRASLSLALLAQARAESERTGRTRRLELTTLPAFVGAPRTALAPDLAAGATERLVVPARVAWIWRPVDVEVRDADGRPLPGVPVSCNAYHRLENRSLVGGGESVTDASGRARLQTCSSPRYALDLQEVRVTARLPFAEPLQAVIGAQSELEEPIVFRVPPHGALDVRVECVDGSPPPPGWSTSLRSTESPSEACFAYAGVVDGRAHFPVVPVGRTLRVSLNSPEAGDVAVTWVAGPSQAGETVQALLWSPPGPPRVRLTVEDEEGQPLQSALVSVNLRCRDAGGNPCRPTGRSSFGELTDRAGQLVVPLEDEWIAGHERWLDVASGGHVHSRVHLSFSLTRQSETDLGVVVLRTPAVLLGGVVQDGAGGPAASVGVSVWPARIDEPIREHDWPWTATTDAAGRFQVRGETDSEQLQVEASASTFVTKRIEVARGRSDLVLRFPPLSRLETAPLLDPGFHALELRFVLRGVEDCTLFWRGGAGWPESARARLDLVGDVQVGRYALEVLAPPAPWPLVRIGDIVVEEGKRVEDPRLDPLDLRERLQRVTFTVRAPGSSDIRVRFEDQEGELPLDAAGRLSFLLPASVKQLELQPRGFQKEFAAQRVDLRASERTLTFGPR